MKAIDAVREVASRTGVPTTHIGKRMGKTLTYVSNTSGRGSTPKADTLAKMLNVCGYALCAVPKDEVPPGAIVIDE